MSKQNVELPKQILTFISFILSELVLKNRTHSEIALQIKHTILKTTLNIYDIHRHALDYGSTLKLQRDNNC